MRDRYLFIRILEACNADCFMCEYALSRDAYRFTVAEFADLLPKAEAAGVRYIRFTGGEPLVHRDVLELIRLGTGAGMKMSLITNGMLLPAFVDRLVEAGLAHIVVSVDGSSARTHDFYRRSPGLFDKAIRGLEQAVQHGLVTRVNTVVGPHNYTEMPALQDLLTRIGAQQWELSSLKLERPMLYLDPDHVRAVCDPLYKKDRRQVLVPIGKRFYGDSPEEQELFFSSSITPRASRPLCHVVDDVIYLDAKRGRGYACSCLPHSDGYEEGGANLRHDAVWSLESNEFRAHATYFREHGPELCNGCTTTAAGYSDDVARLGGVPAWSY